MSEATRTPLTPRDIRRRAYSLMRQCWKPLLIAALLTTLLGSFGDLAAHYGETAAKRIEAAVFAEFEAANPRPADPAALEQWEIERIAHAYFSSADIAGKRAQQLWELIGYGLELLGGLLSAVILVGVYKGLLAQLRGSTEPFRLLAGLQHWKTAVWLQLRVMACIFGWSLLALLPSLILPGWLGLIFLLPVALWAQMHYALVLPHMADNPDNLLSTTQYLDRGTADMQFFTVQGLMRVAWPLLLTVLADTVLVVASVWLPALAAPAALFTLAAEILLSLAGWPILACIFEELRRIREAKADADKDPQQDFPEVCRIS